MKLFTGKLGPNHYSLTITPAIERTTRGPDGDLRQSRYHVGVMTVADRKGEVINQFERSYACEDESRTLNDKHARYIRRDLRDIASSDLRPAPVERPTVTDDVDRLGLTLPPKC